MNGEVRDFSVSRRKDWKGSANVVTMRPTAAVPYAELCGETLALAHSCTGDRVACAAYRGSANLIDRALADVAGQRADQSGQNFAAFLHTIDSGRLQAVGGL
ncbi:hypothetical protein GCM10023166_21300 [Paeniglutamicibacter cryotolerans]|uniref:DUF2252 domain-containing protein n=1 Tax=Paeniglutamicibacter cryotolerans TaxID=670079 RepID=A0A839QEK3_9MICC|nr:hypothetical protein [Paeniglutamicibacter cryotolerans]